MMETLDELIAEFRDWKTREESAKEARRAVAEKIAAALEHPEEGSKTHAVGGYKVTIKGVVNRRVDWELFDGVCFTLPVGVPPPVVQKRELDMRGVRWIQANEPALYARLATAITATPGAVQVEVRDV